MEDLMTNPFLNWLLKATWEASILILVVMALQRVLGKSLTPRWRYLLWLVVVARLLLPISYPSRLSVFTYISPALQRLVASAGATVSNHSIPVSDPAEGLAIAPQSRAASASSPVPVKLTGVPVSSPAAPAAPRAVLEYGWLKTLLLGLADYSLATKILLVCAAVVWPAGVLILMLRLIRRNLSFYQHLKTARKITKPEVLQLLEDCKDTLGLTLEVPLLEVEEIDSPGLFGCWRPIMILPTGLVDEYSERELKHILLHELAHVKRKDMAMNWVMVGLEILHWFNPIVWLGFTRMRAARELACDALVLSRSRNGEGLIYGETIIKLLESFLSHHEAPSLLGLLEDKQEMKERISMITVFKKTSRGSVLALALIGFIALVFLCDAQPPAEPEHLPSGLVAWWRAEKNGADFIGNHAARLEGEVGFGEGRVGKAFLFNGRDTAMVVPASKDLDVGQGSGFTLDTWVKYKDTMVLSSLFEWNVGGKKGVRLFIDDSTLAAEIPALGSNAPVARLASLEGMVLPDIYYHVALTYNRDSGMASLYINGEQQAYSFIGRMIRVTDGDLTFGLHQTATPRRMTCSLDEIQVFNRALSAKEISTLYQAGMNHTLDRLSPPPF